MNDTVINIKTNKILKIKAMKIADDLGFSLSTLINAYLKSLVRNKSVDFSIAEAESHPTNFMIKAMKESTADIKAGRVVSFITPGEEIEYLNKLIKADEDKLHKKVSKAAKKDSIKRKEAISSTANFVYPQSI